MISVIVCSYNRSRLLQAALDTLRKMDVPPNLAWELIVVDNNSTDDTPVVVSDYQRTVPFEVRYVFEPTQGHSHARNRGIVEARGDVLAFTDDDVIVDRLWLAGLHKTYEECDCLGVGGRIVPYWLCAKPPWLRETGRYRLMRAVVSFDEGDDVCSLQTPPFGANMSFKRTAFERHGLFRVDLGRVGGTLLGCEDTEFGARLLRAKETLIYNPRVVVSHPVDEERATLSYFQRWYFEYGRAGVRQAVRPTGSRAQWQRSSVRKLGGNLLRWTLAARSDRRLYYRLAVCEALGQIREAFGPASRSGGPVIPRLAAARPLAGGDGPAVR